MTKGDLQVSAEEQVICAKLNYPAGIAVSHEKPHQPSSEQLVTLADKVIDDETTTKTETGDSRATKEEKHQAGTPQICGKGMRCHLSSIKSLDLILAPNSGSMVLVLFPQFLI